MTYQEFIQNIIATRGQWNIPEGEYYEKHHIVPRCMGGESDYPDKKIFIKNSHHPNCIWLYAREHFIAHKLLAEENPDNQGLVAAYWNMCTLNNKETTHITPEEYEEARIFVHNNFKGYWKDCNSEEHPMYKKDRSGKNNPFYGKTFSDEALEKITKHFKNWKETHPEEFSKNQSRPLGMNGRAIPLRCVETNEYFACLKLAVNWLKAQNITGVDTAKLKAYIDSDLPLFGYHWVSAERLNYKKPKKKNHGWWKNDKNN